MRYRIVESPNGTCRLQIKKSIFRNWQLVKRNVGGRRWVAWTGTYAEAFAECQKYEREMMEKNKKFKYYYPPLTPPPLGAPELKTTELPAYHPGPGAILLNERL